MIIPSSKYPANTAVDLTNYPQGKARNVTASGDGTGTPLEKDWVNDWFGFQQAAVLAAGITPSGTPDTALTSDLLAAIRAVAQQRTIGIYTSPAGVATGPAVTFGLALSHQVGGFTLASNQITVPVAGWYRCTFNALVTGTPTSNPTQLDVDLEAGGGTISMLAWRYSATPSDQLFLVGDQVFNVTSPSTQKIWIQSGIASGTMQFGATAQLVVERVG